MRVATYAGTFIGGMVACYLLWLLGVVDKVDGVPGTQKEPQLSLPTYLGFISVMMTAVTVILAALAIGIGVVAAYTFRELKEEAKTVSRNTASGVAEKAANEVAAKVAGKVATEALSDVNLRLIIDQALGRAIKERSEEWPTEPNEQEDR